jgi:hypothetical protein
MSRKLILTLATAATIAASALASSAADARGFGGGGGGFGGGGHSFGGGSFAHVGGFGGGHFGGGHIGSIGRVGRISQFHFNGHNPGHFQHWSHWQWPHHHRWYWRDGRWFYGEDYVGGGGYAQPVAAYSARAVSTPGPCTCLTKSYTQDGMVVFADLCTKESAAAPVNGRSAEATPMPPQGLSGPPAPPTPPAPPAEDKTSDAAPTQNPSNFAGRTYKDFLAANGLPMPKE